MTHEQIEIMRQEHDKPENLIVFRDERYCPKYRRLIHIYDSGLAWMECVPDTHLRDLAASDFRLFVQAPAPWDQATQTLPGDTP